MEHRITHPAKTVGDLRTYAQKFKQNQFCFKFLLDEIAASYQVAYQNDCISVFRSTSGLIPLKYFSDKKTRNQLLLSLLDEYLDYGNYNSAYNIYAEHLKVIDALEEELRQTSFWLRQKRKNLKSSISRLSCEKLEGAYWCIGLAFYYYCRNSKGDKESFRAEAKDFAVGYLSAGFLLLKKMTNKASFETRQEMDDFLKNNLSRLQYAQLEKVWKKTGYINNESQEIVDDWNELVFVQKMLNGICDYDHYSFECICRQIDTARAKFINRNPSFSTVLRALKIIYDDTPD